MKYNMKHLWFEKGGFANKKARAHLANEFDPIKVKKIAIIRHAALGDQVITRPFLVEARKFFPNAHITLCAVSHYQYGMPSDLVDSVHIMHGKSKNKKTNPIEKIKNIKELPEQDIIFDLAATNRSYWMVALSKAKLKIGFPYRSILNGLLYDIAVLRSDFTAEVDVMLGMLKVLGHNPTYPLDFSYPSNQQHRNDRKPFIIYFNGASQESKMYPIAAQKELLQKATQALPEYQHIFLEGLNEKEKGHSLRVLERHDNFSIQPCLDLEQLTQLLSQATLAVSTDTGIRNLAIATHTPTVGIFYSTVPFRYTPSYEHHHIVMNADASLPSSDQVLSGIQTSLKHINHS
ncbi:ADP-heptose:LPS heptosyltransferase [Oceanisphaera litoralis]|uniref:glycosyltransferase family 9 protein n=1 Tax=Oceanisphaera litoralis TaxID=225144 RepID=UPI00195AEC39|nr:glycosyltransferase family 9 protein [Oceanisphaera litoralis]MBM7456318.1 ADP-heptose:LPS heptosyltransferase [Oceanisphaera litoralis]